MPHFISNFLQENVTRNSQPVTHHDYLTKITNEIIDEDTGVSMEYIKFILKKLDQFGSNTSPMRYTGYIKGLVAGWNSQNQCFFFPTKIYLKTEVKM